jgi:uncharacterized protein (TIGR03435 family)
MFERYTEQARRALFFARYEAFQRGSPDIETEHLLLALFRDEQSVTARVFARARISFDEIRRQVDARTSRHAPLSESSEVPFSDESKQVLRYAAQEADRLLHSHIGTEHLLLGLFREEQGIAASILRELGLRLAAVRDQIVEILNTSSVPPIAFPYAVLSPVAEARLLRVSPSQWDWREGPRVVSSPHRVTADGFTLKELIAWAYRAEVRHVDLPPGFDNHERHDARLDLPGAQSWPTIDRLIREGINKHFGITVTRETKAVDVFVLTAVDGPSPGRRTLDDEPSGGGGGGSMMYAGFSTMDFSTISEPLPLDGPDWRDRLHSVGPISLTATTIADFGQWLEEVVGHPVIDETGLTGLYDIELQGEMQGLDELRQALVSQLGLLLTRSQRDTQVLVVRHSAS